MMVIGKMINFMVMVSIILRININMKVSLKIINFMEMGK